VPLLVRSRSGPENSVVAIAAALFILAASSVVSPTQLLSQLFTQPPSPHLAVGFDWALAR